MISLIIWTKNITLNKYKFTLYFLQFLNISDFILFDPTKKMIVFNFKLPYIFFINNSFQNSVYFIKKSIQDFCDCFSMYVCKIFSDLFRRISLLKKSNNIIIKLTILDKIFLLLLSFLVKISNSKITYFAL